MDLGLHLSSTWALEVSAAFVSVAAFGALVEVLHVANGSIVYSWHGITLNAVVSALATICKLAATYVVGSAISQMKWTMFRKGPQSLLDFEAVDLASRGATGCFKLMWQNRKIATIGASGLILAVVFDPFAQQLVHYKPDVAYRPSSTTKIPRAQRYSAGVRFLVQNAAKSNAEGDWPYLQANSDYLVRSALSSALVQSSGGAAQQLQVACASGNCTWTAYESLAICSTCTDLHPQLRTNYIGCPLSTFLKPSEGPQMNGNYTVYGLPNGLYIDESVAMTSLGTGDPKSTLAMKHLDTLVWSMAMLKMKDGPGGGLGNEAGPISNFQAIECALYYCLNTYESSMTNNNLIEKTTRMSNATRNKDSWIASAADLRMYAKHPYNFTSYEPDSLDYQSITSGISRSDLQLGGHYNVSQSAVDGISSLMYETFGNNGSSQVLTGLDWPLTVNGFYLDPSQTMTGTGVPEYAPQAMQPLWASKSLQEAFDTIAIGMSNAIRVGADNKTTQTGEKGSAVVRFRIEWPWIALPALVVLASVFQLVSSMISSRHVPLFKASTLAVLSRSQLTDGLLDDTPSVKEMNHAASTRKVNLLEDKAEFESLVSEP